MRPVLASNIESIKLLQRVQIPRGEVGEAFYYAKIWFSVRDALKKTGLQNLVQANKRALKLVVVIIILNREHYEKQTYYLSLLDQWLYLQTYHHATT